MTQQHTTRHSWQWLFIAFPALAAVLMALTLTLPALADTVYNVTYPVSYLIGNPCNGENVVVSGNEHDTYHITYDNNGGYHADMHANLQDVTGVGDQGNTYHIPGVYHDTVNGKVGYEETTTETFSFISQGSAPNFIMHFDFHITVNADGTVTSYHNNFTAVCRG